MNRDRPLFVLAGNGPYENRGCEAIVRGTTKILRNHFQDPSFLCISVLQKSELERQCREEHDPAIMHKKINFYQHRFDGEWAIQRIFYRFNAKGRNYRLYKEMLPYLNDAAAVLSVGGDNYSLDYGVPHLFTGLDDIVLEKKRPLLLWGASVGPFDALPEYERFMISHLRNVTGIFARESETVNYLTKNGVTENVRQVADPAFLMDPAEPQEDCKHLTIEEGAIGINLSPLLARYVTGGDLQRWEQIAANIISDIAKKTSRRVYLLPHVTIPGSNDSTFLENVWNLTDPHIKNEIILIPPDYNAAETKWMLSHLSLFAGSRTHATIGALSSNVPTLSFAYSIKAQGINRDIFGHEDYCISPDKLTPEIVTPQIESMLAIKNQIINELKKKIPLMQKNAMNAGQYLKNMIDYP
jgi:polysaccharide pyruvyl transferase WcaK-like protein